MRSFLIALILVAVVVEGRKKPKPSKPKPKPKPKPKWFTRSGTTMIESDGKSPDFKCRFVIKYKKNGWVNWKTSSIKCVKASSSPAPTTAPPAPKGCSIDPNSETDMPEYPPFITDAQDRLVVANGTDDDRAISVKKGESVFLSCPKEDFLNYPSDETLEIRCDSDSGSTFTVVKTDQSAPFSSLGCDKQYGEDFVRTGSSCGPRDAGELVDVGFTVGDKFHWMYSSCHDPALAHNYYVRHTVMASVGANDNNNDRPSFTKDGFYSGYDINGMYTKNSQTEVIGTLIGSADLAEIYVLGGDIYLARGHLAPNADFMTYAWQDATFSFIDVAPQWQSFNAGNWLDVENGVRFLAEYVYGELQVWTGTHGVLQLEDKDGQLVDIYLDDEGNIKVPVPKYFWKVIYDEKTKKGIAIVGVNNPHKTEPNLCTPVEENISWLKFLDLADITSGPVYGCSVQDFSQVVPEFPGGLDITGGLMV